jgi:YVTN family beta-propeller protein
MTAARAEPFAYVTDAYSSITVIDTATKSVVDTYGFNLGAGPLGVAISPDGTMGYFAETYRNRVRAYDLAEPGKALVRIPVGERHEDYGTVGSHPVGVAVTPDGKHVYVTNGFEGSVSVIDAATKEMVVTTIPVGQQPAGIEVAPSGEWVYVANLNSGTVSVIATATNTVVATVPVGANPLGLAATPNGKFVFVTNQGENTVSVINTAKNKVVETIMVGKEPFAVAVGPDGERAYVSNPGSNTVSVISVKDKWVVATVAISDPELAWLINRPSGLSITPDGDSLFIANGGVPGAPQFVSVVSTKTLQITNHIRLPINQTRPLWSLGRFICGQPKVPGSNKAVVDSSGQKHKSVNPCQFDKKGE